MTICWNNPKTKMWGITSSCCGKLYLKQPVSIYLACASLMNPASLIWVCCLRSAAGRENIININKVATYAHMAIPTMGDNLHSCHFTTSPVVKCPLSGLSQHGGSGFYRVIHGALFIMEREMSRDVPSSGVQELHCFSLTKTTNYLKLGADTRTTEVKVGSVWSSDRSFIGREKEPGQREHQSRAEAAGAEEDE